VDLDELRLTVTEPRPPGSGALVIGYGNPLRGDDGAGPEAARRLSEHGIEALSVHQLTPELAERISAARAVFFLDASESLPPGGVAVKPLEASAAGPMEHYASPAALLRLAREVYDAQPEAWLIAMGGAGFELGEGLSEAAERAVSRAVQAVLELGQ